MSAETGAPELLCVGELTYELSGKFLRDADGRQIDLRRQSAIVLDLLAASANRIVSKDELIFAVWPDVSVTDDSLVQCIADIRRILGDVDRTILQTVPRQGYRLIAEAAAQGNAGMPARSADEPSIQLRTPTALAEAPACLVIRPVGDRVPSLWPPFAVKVRMRIASAANAAEVALDGPGMAYRFDTPDDALNCAFVVRAQVSEAAGQGVLPVAMAIEHGEAAEAAVDLAALAAQGNLVVSDGICDALADRLDCEFEDLGDRQFQGRSTPVRVYRVEPVAQRSLVEPLIRPEDLKPTIAVVPFQTSDGIAQWLGEVLVDDIISALARTDDAHVISRLSTSRFRSSGASLREISTTLNAEYVLSGKYQSNGDRVAVDLELAEASSERVMWAERIEEPSGAVAEEFGVMVVSKVRRAIILREVERVRTEPMPTLRAYTLLMGAVGLMHRLSLSGFNQSRELLNVLIEQFPNEPAPLAWMARWHVLRVQQGWSSDPKTEAEMAQTFTARALDCDPDNVLALVNEGMVLTNLLRELDDAEDRYDAALELNPNDAVGRLLRGTLYAFRGEGARAMRDTERALHLSPLDPHRFFFLSLAATACLAADDYERAIMLSRSSLRANRTHTSTLRVKAVAHMRMGDETAAKKTARDLLKLQPDLTVSQWLKTSPSGAYPVGREFADTMLQIGVPA